MVSILRSKSRDWVPNVTSVVSRRTSKAAPTGPPQYILQPFRTLESGFRDMDSRSSGHDQKSNESDHSVFIQKEGLRFQIGGFSGPGERDSYIKHLHSLNVKHVVRVSSEDCCVKYLVDEGFVVHNMQFEWGGIPSPEIIDTWLNLVNTVFPKDEKNSASGETIAIHYDGGLGRAPVLIALALAQLGNDVWDAVAFIRAKGRGAISQKQMVFLMSYKPNPESMKSKRAKSSRGIFGAPFRAIKANRSFRLTPRSSPKSSPNTSSSGLDANLKE